ncbi:hypothetical protein SASPL_145584 [Salvia splendens]|uniref:Myb/SANT-like domain-containing protein n=1 Tax=Salvia splendens TaxID=180675 RepID=A0A8X8Z878_SALSN|nr:hypothetical protein SASPL_145584 [Salvia splendens]
MKDLVLNGWKSENGFWSGYLFQLEDALKQQFPKSNIRIRPHIHSKIIAWKKIYSSLRDILQHRGVGFNAYNDYKIECDDDLWYHIVKADTNAQFFRGKSWPYWEHWQVIFGYDRER